MRQTTRILLAVGLCALGGCAAQPPKTEINCDVEQREFRDQHKAGKLKAASRTFTAIIRDCPASVRGPLRDRVLPFVRDLSSDVALDETRYRIQAALFASGWTAADDMETDYFWLQLAQQHLEHGNIKAARQVSQKIFEPACLLQMRVDRRFDAVVSADRSHFDIAAAIEHKLARLRGEAAASPRSFEPWMRYIYALQATGRDQEGLDAANVAIARGPQAFDEYVRQYPWMLTAKGWMLLALQRVDEGIAALEAAEQYAVGTHEYVNFAINLGDAQERTGHPDAALATFAKVGRTSEYGGLNLQLGIAGAALQTGDLPRAKEAMLKAHELRWNSVRQYTLALLRAGQMDEARELLLWRLRDPNWRGQALADVQNYRVGPRLPIEGEEFARFRELVNLPEVQRVILEFGRIETFDFAQP